ncbi:MAG: 50S ribosomal protein L21 [Candidatus Omnitrophota bacterium]|nr:MAG: 50S ribosomal protein L21 [Candidatus Omnitrophota bacterium]
MWAIVEIGGKQYKVKEGDILEVERMKENSPLLLDKVLLLSSNGEIKIGHPYLEKVKIKAEILGEKKGEKIIVYKYKRRKKYRRKRGHRQIYTRLKILEILVEK